MGAASVWCAAVWQQEGHCEGEAFTRARVGCWTSNGDRAPNRLHHSTQCQLPLAVHSSTPRGFASLTNTNNFVS